MDVAAEFTAAFNAEDVDFTVRGLLDDKNRVFPLGTDTKVLSTVFELLSRPIIAEIADAHGYRVKEAAQTIYPDFTLLNEDVNGKIAIDIKTTYRRGKSKFSFTLGSYTSFLRNNTKNILYPYDQYESHWILGFIYERSEKSSTDIHTVENSHEIIVPYQNVEWFIQEKYKVAGESPGSGNTANIGSIKSSDIEDFREGRGPFSELGEEVFRNYWANYGKQRVGRSYSNYSEYLAWKEATQQ